MAVVVQPGDNITAYLNAVGKTVESAQDASFVLQGGSWDEKQNGIVFQNVQRMEQGKPVGEPITDSGILLLPATATQDANGTVTSLTLGEGYSNPEMLKALSGQEKERNWLDENKYGLMGLLGILLVGGMMGMDMLMVGLMALVAGVAMNAFMDDKNSSLMGQFMGGSERSPNTPGQQLTLDGLENDKTPGLSAAELGKLDKNNDKKLDKEELKQLSSADQQKLFAAILEHEKQSPADHPKIKQGEEVMLEQIKAPLTMSAPQAPSPAPSRC
jgi:hypothetical protein